jgi:hypothetical protein
VISSFFFTVLFGGAGTPSHPSPPPPHTLHPHPLTACPLPSYSRPLLCKAISGRFWTDWTWRWPRTRRSTLPWRARCRTTCVPPNPQCALCSVLCELCCEFCGRMLRGPRWRVVHLSPSRSQGASPGPCACVVSVCACAGGHVCARAGVSVQPAGKQLLGYVHVYPAGRHGIRKQHHA